MEIAVFVGCDSLFTLGESKFCNRLGCGRELLAENSLAGFESYPGDIVLGQHGMSHGANSYGNDIAINADNREMLFAACVNGVCDKLAHILAAADGGDRCVVENLNDFLALFADKKLCHINFLLKIYLKMRMIIDLIKF